VCFRLRFLKSALKVGSSADSRNPTDMSSEEAGRKRTQSSKSEDVGGLKVRLSDLSLAPLVLNGGRHKSEIFRAEEVVGWLS
jgi:hypothetical protein